MDWQWLDNSAAGKRQFRGKITGRGIEAMIFEDYPIEDYQKTERLMLK